MSDARNKGRTAKKLTDAQVSEIRRRHFEDGVSQQRLADEYGVSRTAIRYRLL